MTAIDEHFIKILNFLNEYKTLVDSHLVDFITEDLWAKCLPHLLKIELENSSSELLLKHSCENNNPRTPELNKFFKAIDLLSLEKCSFVHNAADLPKLFSTWGFETDYPDLGNINEKLEFMNDKKSHEVEILAKVTSSLAKLHSNIIIDAGAGKGYLSEFLSQKYQMPVLAIDSSHVNHSGAVRRQNIIRRKSSQSISSVHHLVQWIDDSTDFKKLAETHFPDQSIERGLTITGLHTCGSLGHSVIKAFLQTECIKSLCVVTCCYHLADTSITGRVNFSKNAKMLAQQSVERMHEYQQNFSPTLHYRAVLQVLLHSLGLHNARVGRGAPVDNFVTYAKWALRKIGLDSDQIPEDSILEKLYLANESFKVKMEMFQVLRVRLGSVVETAILLDRILYLEQSKVCSKFTLLRLFDPVISPRCYGIVAIK